MTVARELAPSSAVPHGIFDDARWLSIRQIAGDLGVSSSTAYKWSARGVPWFPRTIRLHNGDIRVRRDCYERRHDRDQPSHAQQADSGRQLIQGLTHPTPLVLGA
jgi:predicted DNA-binding transcriptional regulator AlpA